MNVADHLKAPKSKPVTRDADIRSVLLASLTEKYSDKNHDLIVEEFGCKAAGWTELLETVPNCRF